MNANLLRQYFGQNREWRGPCVAVLDADATIQSPGADAIVQGGAKMYAPRMISGRVTADFACLLAEEDSLLLVQSHRIRQATGEDLQQDTLLVVDLKHVAAMEFPNLAPLSALEFQIRDRTIKSSIFNRFTPFLQLPRRWRWFAR